MTDSEHEETPTRTLHDYLHPTRTSTLSCIIFPPNMPHIDLKPGMIQLLPTFHGLENENSYVHIKEFEEVVAIFHNQRGTMDAVRLNLFPFSLKERAKSWLYSLRPRLIGSWAEMTQAFFDLDEAIDYLDDLAEKAHTWTGPSATESTNRSRPTGNLNSTGIYHLKEEDDLRAKVDALTKELKILRARGSKLAQNASHVESLGPCFVCGGTDHPA
ncbi:uncharacterized protein LOC111412612 [Olea europaea var. sylvestris]|uniref:uncharacterized protein LOC111412612 n=1 Tax=Olea europaea var. sylvestris TaxID=158386 RepID=UPI000C1D40FD|nr:uncharacterized protein LOC111412612 [Olea europaea var. sylvestris]